MAIQRLQCLLDKLDSFERSNSSHKTLLRKTSENNVKRRTDQNTKQCDAAVRQSVATTNKRVVTMKNTDASKRQEDVAAKQSDANQWSGDSTLQQLGLSAGSTNDEPTSNESSPEIPHSVLLSQHRRGPTVVASSLPNSSRTCNASDSNTASKRPKATSSVLPTAAGSEQLLQITSTLQQIQSDLQTLEHMHRTSQVSVQSKLQTLEGSFKSLEGRQCASCSPHPLSSTSSQLHSILKPTNAISSADSFKVLSNMPPPKTLPQLKPALYRPHSAGAQDKGQQLEVCANSRWSTNSRMGASQVGRRRGRQGSCAMCAATSLGVPHLTSRSLLKVVYNSSYSCPIHEDFAKWAFTTKQQRGLLRKQNPCGSTTTSTTSLHYPPAPAVVSPADTPRSLPSSVATTNQNSALQELALNESYIMHKAEEYRATAKAERRSVSPALSGPNRLACDPVSALKVSAPSRDAGLSCQQVGSCAVSSNVSRRDRNFKRTPAKKSRVRDVFDFHSSESSPDAENRLPLRRLGGTKANKVCSMCRCMHSCTYIHTYMYVIEHDGMLIALSCVPSCHRFLYGTVYVRIRTYVAAHLVLIALTWLSHFWACFEYVISEEFRSLCNRFVPLVPIGSVSLFVQWSHVLWGQV